MEEQDEDIKEVKRAMEEQQNQILSNNRVLDTDWLSSGSTLLNLAASGRPDGAFAKGKYFWMVGDSSSGKTFLTMTSFAEASINPNFDKYDLIFNNAEDGALMDIRKYFGSKLAQRLKAPEYNAKGEPVYSRTTEEFWYHIDDRLTLVEKKKAPPFIELLDSMDALSTKYEGEKFQQQKKALRSKTAAPGDYGDGKAKLNSKNLRTLIPRLRDTGCILIILSQTRDVLDAGMFEEDKTHAGGHALKFYATWQLWSSIGRTLKKEINGTDRQIGIVSNVRIKKNRLTGKQWSVKIPIYWSTGIDDIGSQIDFLFDEKHFANEEGSTKLNIPDLGFVGRRSQLIKHIEEKGLEKDLQEITAEVWKNIEKQCEVERKPRYE